MSRISWQMCDIFEVRSWIRDKPLLQQIYCLDASFWPCEANSLDEEGLVHTLVYLCVFSLIFIWITFWSFHESLGTVGGVPPEDWWSRPMFTSGIFQMNEHRKPNSRLFIQGMGFLMCIFLPHPLQYTRLTALAGRSKSITKLVSLCAWKILEGPWHLSAPGDDFGEHFATWGAVPHALNGSLSK